jgi:hypothetical protein
MLGFALFGPWISGLMAAAGGPPMEQMTPQEIRADRAANAEAMAALAGRSRSCARPRSNNSETCATDSNPRLLAGGWREPACAGLLSRWQLGHWQSR